jgi:hypothetical protein
MKGMLTLCGLLALLIGLPSSLAGHRPGGHCHCEIRCPRCKCCVSEVEIEKVEKPCWEVVCEPVCIPQVTFPWELPDYKLGCGWFCCPPAKCGKVRMVHVLKEEVYECQECHYKFTPVCCGCDHCATPATSKPPEAIAPTPEPPAPPPPPLPMPSAARQPREFRFLPRLR